MSRDWPAALRLPRRHLPRALAATVAVIGLAGTLRAQTTISTPIVIPLEKVTVAGSSGPYAKLGIWAALGDGTPQLFEFDTGAAGFYAAFSANPSASPWWGTAGVTPSTVTANKTFASGFLYSGTQATAAVSIFASADPGSRMLSSGPGTLVGQADLIVDTKQQPATTLWNGSQPVPASAPPIDGVFWGDFGASLEPNATNPGLVNVLAQFTYTNGVQSGFIVHAGPNGSNAGASVQVGVTAADMATFPIQFSLTSVAGSFSVSGFSNYPLQLVTGTLSLDGNATSPAIGVTFDTGNQTPVIFQTTNNVPAALVTPGGELVASTVATVTANGTTIFSVAAGPVEGLNRVVVATSQSGIYSINLGLPVFEQYDVAFNDETGVLGLRPIPEPSGAWLVAFAVGAAGAWARFRPHRRKPG